MLMKINGLVRLAKEPEIKYLPSGVSATSFTIVGSEKYKDNEKTCFIDCVCFGALGEKVIIPYVHKGNQIFISGKLEQQSWEYEGRKMSKHLIQVDGVELVSNGNNQQNNNNNSNNNNNYVKQPINQQKMPYNEVDDEIPF